MQHHQGSQVICGRFLRCNLCWLFQPVGCILVTFNFVFWNTARLPLPPLHNNHVQPRAFSWLQAPAIGKKSRFFTAFSFLLTSGWLHLLGIRCSFINFVSNFVCRSGFNTDAILYHIQAETKFEKECILQK